MNWCECRPLVVNSKLAVEVTDVPNRGLPVTDVGIVTRFTESLRDAWRNRNQQDKAYLEGTKQSATHELLYLRARAMARSGALEMSIRLFADAEDFEPTFAEAIEAQGEALDKTSHPDAAAKKYEAARRVRAAARPGAPDRHFVLRQRGHFIAEIIAYDSVLRSLKKNALPYIARGNAYLASGRPEKALHDYERALRLKPRLTEIMALKGEALGMLGRYVEALRAFDVAIAAMPSDAEALNGRAIVHIALGHVAKANADWRRQFDLLRDKPAARACVALRMADYKSAVSQLESAIVREPADPYWQLYLLAAERRLGRPARSVDVRDVDVWPGPLLALHAGRMNEQEMFQRADTSDRRAEAAFQVGILASARDSATAERSWREVVELASPSLIEYAAARSELARRSP